MDHLDFKLCLQCLFAKYIANYKIVYIIVIFSHARRMAMLVVVVISPLWFILKYIDKLDGLGWVFVQEYMIP